MNGKNDYDKLIEKWLPEPLRKYSNQIVVNLVFIVGLILLGWAFGNRFLLRLGFASLLVYALIMTIVIFNVIKK